MLKLGRLVATSLLVVFLIRITILYSPGIYAVSSISKGILPLEIAPVIDNSYVSVSTHPGPDLNVPMVKDSEENLKEQLLKCVKHPMPFLIFIFSIVVFSTMISLPAFSPSSVRGRPSRLYLSVSILRI